MENKLTASCIGSKPKRIVFNSLNKYFSRIYDFISAQFIHKEPREPPLDGCSHSPPALHQIQLKSRGGWLEEVKCEKSEPEKCAAQLCALGRFIINLEGSARRRQAEMDELTISQILHPTTRHKKRQQHRFSLLRPFSAMLLGSPERNVNSQLGPGLGPQKRIATREIKYRSAKTLTLALN